MINATLPDTESNEIAKKMVKLSDFKTARQLAAMKVKYVLVHRQEYLDTELVSEREELGSIAKNHGLRFVRNFSAEGCDPGEMCVQVTGPVDVYEVVAKH